VPNNVASATRRHRRQAEVDEVGWLLGITVTIRVIPAADGNVLSILAGDGQSVLQRGQPLCDAAWTFAVPRRAGLVIASVGCDRRDQTWANVARALAAARRAVADQGAIVVCADLRTGPGPALRRLGDIEDPDAALRALRRDRSPDAGTAVQLIRTALRGRVYLLCGLAADVVEQIGVAPVAGGHEIGRLARQHGTYILLGNAQHAVPQVMEERATARAAHGT
jgi:nickel-dependent lactate racemase